MSAEGNEPSWAKEMKASLTELSKDVRVVREEVIRMEATSASVATMKEELAKVREQSLTTKVTLSVLAAALSFAMPFALKAVGVLGGDASPKVEQLQRDLQGLQARDRDHREPSMPWAYPVHPQMSPQAYHPQEQYAPRFFPALPRRPQQEPSQP